MESRNETHYSGCREYGAESIRFEIGLKSPIHSETAAAGDAVTGVILRDVKDVARANDIVRGRIPRLEQFMPPAPRWVVAIRFNRLEHNGVEPPLEFRPIDDGNGARRNTILLEKRTPGAGVFIFPQTGNLVLDQKFHSEWETR